MKSRKLLNAQTIGLAGTIAGGLLLSLPVLASAASYPLNPCPGIYYEEPFSSTRIVPQGCPPNAATQEMLEQGELSEQRYDPSAAYSTNPDPQVQPSEQGVVAVVEPVAGEVSVKLQNNTNAAITYQAVGYTERQLLAGRETTTLRNLPTPVTIRLARPDGGLIDAIPVTSTQAGLLEVALDETVFPGSYDRSIRVQSNGQVLLN